MYKIARNIGIAVRAERLITRRQFAVIRAQTTYLAFAALAAGIGVVMLNVAGFFALRAATGDAVAALIVGAADIVLAGGFAILAARQDAERETESVAEVRDIAIRDLEHDVRGIIREAEKAGAKAKVYLDDPGGILLGKVLEPLISMLLRRSGD